MAVQIMSDVWEYSAATGTRLLVLLAIADAADRQSREAFPGLRLLSRYARIRDRQALAHIEALIEMGEIERVRGGRVGSRAVYRVLVGTRKGEAKRTLDRKKDQEDRGPLPSGEGAEERTLESSRVQDTTPSIRQTGRADRAVALDKRVQAPAPSASERVQSGAEEGAGSRQTRVQLDCTPSNYGTNYLTEKMRLGAAQRRVEEALADDDLARTAFTGLCRASQNPEAWAAEVEALATGLTPPGYPWPVVALALRELSANGAAPNVRLLRSYCRRVQSTETDGVELRSARELREHLERGGSLPPASWERVR